MSRKNQLTPCNLCGVHDVDSCRFAIDLGRSVYHLRADSKEARQRWLVSLTKSQAFFQNLLKKKDSSSLSRNNSKRGEEEVPLRANDSKENVSKGSLERRKEDDNTANKHSDAFTQIANLDSDDLQEVLKMKYGLLKEVKRIQAKLQSMTVDAVENYRDLGEWIAQVFSTDITEEISKSNGRSIGSLKSVTQSFSDLISWSIYVLETSSSLFAHRSDSQVLSGPSSSGLNGLDDDSLETPFDEDLDDKETELEFFDATSDVAFVSDACVDSNHLEQVTTKSSFCAPEMKGGKDLLPEKYTQRRTRLPVSRGNVKRPSLWSVLKDAVGKDVSRISIPVAFNEPLSFLQRMAEDIEYSDLLDRASQTEDPFQRLLLISAMALSHYCSAEGRIAKPFNPLLGETFELVMPEKNNLKFMSEQVSHHPPISASFAMAGPNENPSWTYSAVHMVANKFWGKSIEVFPTGPVQISIPRFGDYITYEKATTCVHNILIGKVWIDNYGEMVLKNHTTGDYAVIKLRKTGWLSNMTDFGEVRGIVYDKNGKVQKSMSGTWHDALYEDLPNGKKQLIWTANKRPPSEESGGYNFTSYAIILNELTPELKEIIAPTDSRFRPDQRALENAQYKVASDEKFRLEEKQRAARKEREVLGRPYEPCWFDRQWNNYLEREEWTFNYQYWQHRERRDWSRCPDVF
eukprot:jgi/Galph1/2467/GphlegSOOS_G1094.1